MARLNNDAREILCNMVTDKAKVKRKALTDELAHVEDVEDRDYRKRLDRAGKELDLLAKSIDTTIKDIFFRLGLEWREVRYGAGRHTFEDIFNNGMLTEDLSTYIGDKDGGKSARHKALKDDIEELDAAVAKAKQEILLRAALGMKYDEVVAIVNSFQF